MTAARADVTAALASALLLNLTAPPFHLFLPSMVCLVPAIVALERDDPRRSPVGRQFRLGFLFGVGGYAILLHWMAAALWRFEPRWVAGYAAGVAFLALVSGLGFAAVGLVRRRTGLPIVVVFPVMWTTVEWLLAQPGPFAFTWLGLGTTLTGFPVAIQAADLVGARGLGFLLAAANAALAAAWIYRAERARALRLVAGVAAGCAVVALYGAARMRWLESRTLFRVALVQTDVGPGEKWDPRLTGSVVGEALALSLRAAEERPGLIVWPETALPGALLYHPEWDQAVGGLARHASAFVLAGAIDAVPSGRELRQYNAAFLFSPDGGRREPAYRKQRLVPVFEWGNRIEAAGRGVLLPAPPGRIGVLICGESTYESVARRHRRAGADALVSLSNDAWFAAGTGAAQHAAHLVMRAVETRTGAARAANRGISMIVDPLGRIVAGPAAAGPGVLVGSLDTTDSVPVYVRLGDWVGGLSAGAAAVLLLLAAARVDPSTALRGQ